MVVIFHMFTNVSHLAPRTSHLTPLTTHIYPHTSHLHPTPSPCTLSSPTIPHHPAKAKADKAVAEAKRNESKQEEARLKARQKPTIITVMLFLPRVAALVCRFLRARESLLCPILRAQGAACVRAEEKVW